MNLLDLAGVLVALALVEYIQAPIAPILVHFFVRETPPEVGAFHSMKPSIIWVVRVRARVVTAAAATSLTASSSSTAAKSSL